MADAEIAIDFVMPEEDGTGSGVETRDAGGRTRYGIAEKYHPELTPTGFFDVMPAPQALALARQTMLNGYWAPINGDRIADQYPANRLLSFAVNMGVETAVMLLQQSLNTFGVRLAVDGEPGPQTIAALNATYAAQSATLMARWRAALTAHYQAIVAANPGQGEYLKGWLARVAS